MSSEVEGFGVIAAAVALPVAVAFGAGWLAWQTGKLLLEANAAADRTIEEAQQRIQEAQRQRRRAAEAANEQLRAMCAGVLEELERSGGAGIRETEELKQELWQLCVGALPDSTARLESLNAMGAMKLEQIVSRRERLKAVRLSGAGTYDGFAVADLMEDLRLAVSAARIAETGGADVVAADPLALERADLNRRLADVGARVMGALRSVVDLSENYGLSAANDTWFRSCFSDVDQRIDALCLPTVSNGELKKGIRALEEIMQRFDMLYPSLEKEARMVAQLYPVYADAARALGETVRQRRDFKSAAELEAAMARLQKRAERAEKCAAIYRRLGPAAYMCYAWDEELRAMGYTVHTRRQIAEMAGRRPERARLGEVEMPFYQWDREALTQIYHVAPSCDLQLIVHPDGAVSMQSLVEQGDRDQAVRAQRAHCAGVEALRRRLWENWFLSCDCEETADAEHVLSVEAWRGGAENSWTRSADEDRVPGVRENVRTETRRTMQRE